MAKKKKASRATKRMIYGAIGGLILGMLIGSQLALAVIISFMVAFVLGVVAKHMIDRRRKVQELSSG